MSRRVRHLSCFHDRRRTLLALSGVLVTVDGEREDKYRSSSQWKTHTGLRHTRKVKGPVKWNRMISVFLVHVSVFHLLLINCFCLLAGALVKGWESGSKTDLLSSRERRMSDVTRTVQTVLQSIFLLLDFTEFLSWQEHKVSFLSSIPKNY